MRIIQEDLGRPLEEVFSYISERPVAAASLGQVCYLLTFFLFTILCLFMLFLLVVVSRHECTAYVCCTDVWGSFCGLTAWTLKRWPLHQFEKDTDFCIKLRQHPVVWLLVSVLSKVYSGICTGACWYSSQHLLNLNEVYPHWRDAARFSSRTLTLALIGDWAAEVYDLGFDLLLTLLTQILTRSLGSTLLLTFRESS